MTRGNQRDLAREKAAKAAKGKSKAASEQDGNKGMTKEQRMQRDADRMREKQAWTLMQFHSFSMGTQLFSVK